MTYQLKSGDILLYRPSGLFGRLIAVKTWHAISHVEIYAGIQRSFASRDGLGVDHYPVRTQDLAYVLRPQVLLDFVGGVEWFEQHKGAPYGWLDLLNFIGVPIDSHGMVCSSFAAGFLRACDWDIFPTDPINRVAPFQFLDLVGPQCVIAYNLQ